MSDTEPHSANEAAVHEKQAYPQRLATGIAGALVVALGAVLLTIFRVLVHPAVPNDVEYVVLLVVAFLVMALFELAIFRVHRRQLDFSRRRVLTAVDQHDIMCQFAALITTLAVAWAAYGLLGEYGLNLKRFFSAEFAESWYSPFFRMFRAATIGLPLLAVPYLYLCALYRRWPRDEDELLRLWSGYMSLIRGRRPESDFFAAWRSLLVKFFFVPVMTVFFIKNASVFESTFIRLLAGPWQWDGVLAGKLFYAMYEFIFLVDVNLSLLGYVCCFRLLDTHIRSAQPAFLGWVVALVCYPPFNRHITSLYLPHANAHTWENVLSSVPGLYNAVGAGIILLLGIYLYATIAFGFRFSNLTNRGIIRRGPYAWVRHPAYAAKNLAWWLLSLPFLVSPAACIRLVLLNGIYVLRALTEERHLARDPAYREYMKKVKYRFIPGVW